MKTRFRKAKKYIYTKDCKEKPREISAMVLAKKKDVRIVQKSRGEDEKAKQGISAAPKVSVEVNFLFE